MHIISSSLGDRFPCFLSWKLGRVSSRGYSLDVLLNFSRKGERVPGSDYVALTYLEEMYDFILLLMYRLRAVAYSLSRVSE